MEDWDSLTSDISEARSVVTRSGREHWSSDYNSIESVNYAFERPMSPTRLIGLPESETVIRNLHMHQDSINTTSLGRR